MAGRRLGLPFVLPCLLASGTSWLEDGKLCHLPAFEVKSLDTLGAGDVFHGVFALGLAEGFSEKTSLINALRV